MTPRAHRQMEHRENARDERLWMTEAGADKRNLHGIATGLRRHGDVVRANFMEHEAQIAGSFHGKRKRMLDHELGLARK